MSEADAAKLARRLREVREYLGLTQKFVADQTGINRVAVIEIEQGKRKVDSLELKRLANLYRYPVQHFLEEEPTYEEGSASVAALARAAGELTEEDRRQVMRFADFLRNYKRKPD